MPSRYLKDSIKYSRTLGQLSNFEEVCFYRLLVSVDDYGCFYRDPQILKSELFPLKGDLTVKSIDDAFETLERVSLIKSYWVSGERYLYVVTWKKHQRSRTTKRKFPDPDGSDVICGDPPQVAASCRKLPQDAADGRNLPPYSYSNSYSTAMNDTRATPPSTPFISDGDAEAIRQDHDDIFARMRYCGFEMNQKSMDDVISLYVMYGRDAVMSAIDECSGAKGDKVRYLRKVLGNAGRPKPEEDEECETFNWL